VVTQKLKKSVEDFFSWRNIKELSGLLLLVFLIRTFGFGLYQVPSGSMETTMLVGERFFADKFTYLFIDPKRGDILSMNDPTFQYSSGTVKRLFEEYVWGPSNWTKRVIGVPGDVIEGKIEDGKPVVYLNDKKLDEPYLNKYPIIGLWQEDPNIVRKEVQSQVSRYVATRQINPADAPRLIDQLMQRRWAHVHRSFSSDVSWYDQSFYRINPKRIYYNAQGKESILYPGTPSDRELPDRLRRQGKNHWNGSDVFYIELGPNQYWCMGDNRLGSSDSRVFGPFERRLIHGRILFRIWSVDSDESWWIFDLIKHPIDFWSRIRWSRSFQWVN